jgi:hypothetical protein
MAGIRQAAISSETRIRQPHAGAAGCPELCKGRKDPKYHRQAAYRLMMDPRIQLAVAEEAATSSA